MVVALVAVAVAVVVVALVVVAVAVVVVALVVVVVVVVVTVVGLISSFSLVTLKVWCSNSSFCAVTTLNSILSLFCL